jgi:hypothetical protein
MALEGPGVAKALVESQKWAETAPMLGDASRAIRAAVRPIGKRTSIDSKEQQTGRKKDARPPQTTPRRRAGQTLGKSFTIRVPALPAATLS